MTRPDAGRPVWKHVPTERLHRYARMQLVELTLAEHAHMVNCRRCILAFDLCTRLDDPDMVDLQLEREESA